MKKKTICILLAAAALSGCGRETADISTDTEYGAYVEDESYGIDTENTEDTAGDETVEEGSGDSASEGISQEEDDEADESVSVTEETITEYVYRDDLPFEKVIKGSGKMTTVGKEQVNYRTGPSTDYEIVGVVPKGTEMTVTGHCDDGNGWYVVDVDGETYYMSGRWLEGDFTPETTTTVVRTETPAADTRNNYNLDTSAVITKAYELASDAGYTRTEDLLYQKYEDGKLSEYDYNFLLPTGRGDYGSITVRISSDDTDGAAERLARLLKDGYAYYFTEGDEITLGSLKYIEFRCYYLK